MAKDLTDAWAALSNQAVGSTTRDQKGLPEANPVSPIPARSGSSKPGSGNTGSIASPLIEDVFSTRTYWTDQVISSTDGLFVIKIKPIKQMSFKDSKLSPVVINYSQPI